FKPGSRKAGSNARNFTEGWVEFRDKRVAKLVSRSLNNTRIGAKKRSIFHDDLWCMKYLHRFRWTHLSERLAYERLVRGQRLRAEVSQVKRESNFILQNVEKSSNMEHLRQIKQQKGQEWQEKSWHFTQRQTEQEIQQSKAGKRERRNLKRMAEIQTKSESNISLLAKIFNPPAEQVEKLPSLFEYYQWDL
uniref:Activator of basal transcription 1 n=1 Tax=Callorhinchus milii TaxID=7868 RepID=A0A4W3GTI6_CALMI